MKRKLRLGMIGGGQGAFIGAVHRLAARIDDKYEFVAGCLSSTPEKAEESAKEIGLDLSRSYPDFKTMAEEESKREDEKIGILELSNPINDKKIKDNEEDRAKLDISIADTINEKQIRQAVRDTVASFPNSKLDQIINEELTKVIQERLNSSKIIISTENKKN